ncbi:MAG: TonB-dependent receptor [Paludibacteraceae bacterium]|nr:TonB-dependent receptor [Paludibacteraceae bacterium]
MKYITLSLIFLLMVACAWADDLSDATIIGHVIEAETNEHLPFVNIQLKGLPQGGTTDATGHYLLTNLPVGDITLVFSMVGYETEQRTVRLSAGQTCEVNVLMHETSMLLDNVVVTASKYETKQKEAAGIVNVVSPVMFETTSSNSMADVLNYQTGLRVEMSCSNCGVPQLRINGLEGQYSQILMDSRPIFSSLASVYGLEQVPAGMVDRVEVIRGGGSALYGANAIAGVVNIITKEPSKNFVNVNHTSSYMENNAYDINTAVNASVVTPDRKAGLFLFAVQRNRKQYDRDDDGFSDIPKLNSTTAGFRGFFKVTDYSKLTVEYHHVTEFRRGGCQVELPPHETDLAEQLRHNIDAASLRFDWYSTDSLHVVSAYANAQYIGRDSYFGTNKNPDAYGLSNDLTTLGGVQYRFSYPCGWLPADLSVGAEYSYNKLRDQILGYNRDLTQQIHLYGAYVQNEWRNEVLSLLVGGRLEKHSLLQRPVFTPRANVRYTPVPNVVLRVSYSSGYRAPQTYEEDLHVGAVGGEVSLISLAPDLRSEYSHSVSGSVDLYRRVGAWEMNLTTEGFFTQLNRVFALVENGYDNQGNLLLLRTNASGARVAGLNIEGKVAYKTLFSMQVGYTFQQSRYVDPFQWSEQVEAQRRMFRTPDNYGYLLASVEPVKRFTIALNGKLTGSMLVQHYAGYVADDVEVTTPVFCELGVKLSYEIPLYKNKILEVNGGVKNLLDHYQRDLDQGASRDAGYIYGPAQPRTYFVGLNLKL